MEERLIINQRTHLKMQLNVIRICQFELIMMDQLWSIRRLTVSQQHVVFRYNINYTA